MRSRTATGLFLLLAAGCATNKTVVLNDNGG